MSWSLLSNSAKFVLPKSYFYHSKLNYFEVNAVFPQVVLGTSDVTCFRRGNQYCHNVSKTL